MLKKFVKKIASFKCLFVNGEKNNAFIHPCTAIKGYKKIYISKDVKIIAGNRIAIDAGIIILKENTLINANCNIFIKRGKLILGKNSYFNNNCTVITIGEINIGENVMIGPMCNLLAGKHNYKDNEVDYKFQGDTDGSIVIEDNVWIGAGSVILSGIRIAKGSIIGAGSVVTKSIGENEIWAGNPAKFIKKARVK